jgi:hypothetical protein
MIEKEAGYHVKIFVEYMVHVEKISHYLAYVQELKRSYARVRVYEGLRQPGLYVEEWEGYSEAFFDELRAERAQVEHPFWSQLDFVLVDGRKKMNIWIFREI